MGQLTQSLLEAFVASRVEGTYFDLNRWLANQDNHDSQLQQMAQLMTQTKQPNENSDAIESKPIINEQDQSEAVSVDIGVEQQQLIHRMSRQMRTMLDDLRELQSRNDMLAKALGACPVCWGDDPECSECKGAGAPGSYIPDFSFFSRFVIPAIHSLHALRTHSRKTVLPSESLDHINKGDENV